jgi:anthranilate phosphoribosyltransferase
LISQPPMDHMIAKIGKGLKGAKDLTWEEAKFALNSIIEGQATAGQIGAFLMAMRIKTESIAELAAFTATARMWASPIQFPDSAHMVDIPLYAEKHNTIHIVVAASLVAAAAGAKMFMHGVENPTLDYDLPQVLQHMKLPIAQSAQEAVEQGSQQSWVYMDLAGYHAPLAKLLDLRREFGLQNLSHQVARLLNPARLPSQIIGIAHPPYLNKMAEALDMLGTQRALIIQGVEGFPELSLSTSSAARELRDGHISPLMFRPEDAGFRFGVFQTMSAKSGTLGATGSSASPEHEAHTIIQLLENRQRGDQRPWVIFNAALFIYAAGLASSLAQATPLAHDVLDSGKVGLFFQNLVNRKARTAQSPDSHPFPMVTI